MSEWKPAETAPFDTDVLVYDRDEGIVVGNKTQVKQWVYWWPRPVSYETDQLWQVTHWMPLPEKPNA